MSSGLCQVAALLFSPRLRGGWGGGKGGTHVFKKHNASLLSVKQNLYYSKIVGSVRVYMALAVICGVTLKL